MDQRAVKKTRPLYDTASRTNYEFDEYWNKIGSDLGKNPEEVKKRWNGLRSVYLFENSQRLRALERLRYFF
ncbi:unnamed protein product [Meloidogyne enterolobii]|uniref:Uncharacterized protein n=1 Tax=Meloidogyne enterolobii TaxID=390850 RepID=A0ACB0YW42_MELEN